MAWTPMFDSPVRSIGTNTSFRQFQDLPTLVRQALVWGIDQVDNQVYCGSQDLVGFIINRYDVNQALPIGSLVDIVEKFITNSRRQRMVRCYVDHHCDMLAAKLAWREDY